MLLSCPQFKPTTVSPPSGTVIGDRTKSTVAHCIDGSSAFNHVLVKISYRILFHERLIFSTILAPFPRYSFRHVQRRYIWLPLLRLTPAGGVTWDDLRKILRGGQQMARLQNGVETFPKISTG